MRGSMGVLGRAGLAGDREGAGVAGGGARRPPLDHGDHRTTQYGNLIDSEIERGVGSSAVRRTPHDEGETHGPIARELLIEPDHLCEGLRVLALSDRQVQSDGGRPASRPVQAIVILRAGRKLRRRLTGEIDSRAPAKPPLVRVFEQRGDAQLDAQLIEVDVAALCDRFGERQVTMSVRFPTTEIAIAVLQATPAGDRHAAVWAYDAPLESHRRDRKLPRRSGRVSRL